MSTQTASRSLRVVIENADWDRSLAQMVALDRAGFSVTACSGPSAFPDGACPVVSGRRCPWLDTADVVLYDLDLDDADDRRVLQATRRRYPDLPVVVEQPTGTTREHAAVLEGCHVVHPFDMDKLVQAVIDAVPGGHAARAVRGCAGEVRPVATLIGCSGEVRLRPKLVPSEGRYPMCDAHWAQQRAEQERIEALPED